MYSRRKEDQRVKATVSLKEKIKEIDEFNKLQRPRDSKKNAPSLSETDDDDDDPQILSFYESDRTSISEEKQSEKTSYSENSSDDLFHSNYSTSTDSRSEYDAHTRAPYSSSTQEQYSGDSLDAEVNLENAQHFLMALQYVCKRKTNLAGVKWLLATIMYPRRLFMFERANAFLNIMGIDEIEVMEEFDGLAQNLKDALISNKLTENIQHPQLDKVLDSFEVILRVMASVLCSDYIFKTKDLLDKCQCGARFAGMLIEKIESYTEEKLNQLLDTVTTCSACQYYKELLSKHLSNEPNWITQLISVLVEWKECTSEQTHQSLNSIKTRIKVLTNVILKMSFGLFNFTEFPYHYLVNQEVLVKRCKANEMPALEMLLIIEGLDWEIIQHPEDLLVDFEEKNELAILINLIFRKQSRTEDKDHQILDLTIRDKDNTEYSSDEDTQSVRKKKQPLRKISNEELKKYLKARNAREFIIPCPSGPGDQDHSDDELRDLEGQTSIYETPKQSVYHEKNESSEEESFDRPLHELEQEESTDSTDGLLNVEERMNIWIKKRLDLRKVHPSMRTKATANVTSTGSRIVQVDPPRNARKQANRTQSVAETSPVLLPLTSQPLLRKRTKRTLRKKKLCPRDWKKKQEKLLARMARQRREILAFRIKIEQFSERDPGDEFMDLND